jgi:Transposase DDE domain
MAHATPLCGRGHLDTACRRFAEAAGLPFAGCLPAGAVEDAVRSEGVCFRDRLYPPAVTVWVFLSQVLDAAHCCRQAVARFLAWRVGQGLAPCSADAGAYCKARGRLPEGLLARLARDAGRRPVDEAPDGWRWRGRTVKVVDGTTIALADTPANQREYPQPRSQKPGVGFPLVRMVVLFALTTGTALDAAMGPCRGKRTGESALFRGLHDGLQGGDILLADRYYCSYFELALVGERGCDAVFRMHQRRRVDFRRGRRLGPSDHVVTWAKPARPEWLTPREYARLPMELTVREVRVWINRPGYRTRVLVVATTLLDPEAFSWREAAALYGARWYAELDLRAIKDTLQMGVLRGKTPAMARKEVWAHLLAYNLIRGLMARAAQEAGLLPWQVSFAGAVQTATAFAPLAWAAKDGEWEEIGRRLRAALVEHRVNDRPGRCEPRAQKRRPQTYPLLNEPRDRARDRLTAKRCA